MYGSGASREHGVASVKQNAPLALVVDHSARHRRDK